MPGQNLKSAGKFPDILKLAVLSAIVESSEDAIISKDLNGNITSWNNGAQRIFEYAAEEVLGKHISILIPNELLSEEEHIIKSIRAGKRVDHFKTVRVTKSGRRLHISLTISPVKDADGNIVGASKIARDISRDILRENQILQYTRRLEMLNAVSSEISGLLDEHSILQPVTDATTKITGAAFGAFFYNAINEEGESYLLYTISGAPKEAFEKLGAPRNTPLFHTTFAGLGVVRVADVTKDPRYGHIPPHYGMPEGHLPVVSYLAVPVKSVSGNVIGGLFFGHPEAGVFTEEHEDMVSIIASQASVALENCRLFAEVKKLSDKKDEFIALASHELKTPLTTISGYLQVLQQQIADDTAKTFLDKSLRQVHKLNELVTDMFDVSKIEAGKLVLDFELFDIKDLLLEVIETYRFSAKSHTVYFEAEGTGFAVEADRQRIEQVIQNLITNAIKYSPAADEVFVKLKTGTGEVTVMVKDEGIGLGAAEQKKIFSRFYRVEGNRNISGLGLGLYLSNEIIKRHNGKMYVKSEIGKGAEFYFTFPSKKRPA